MFAVFKADPDVKSNAFRTENDVYLGVSGVQWTGSYWEKRRKIPWTNTWKAD